MQFDKYKEFYNAIVPPLAASDVRTDDDLYNKIANCACIYDFWCEGFRQGIFDSELDHYYQVDAEFYRKIRTFYKLYSPVIKPELATVGEIEINVINKRLERTGKKTNVKIGRALGLIAPFLTDRNKESIATWVKDTYSPLDLNFNMVETGFEDIVTMRQRRATHFNTTKYFKQIDNSCMRHAKHYFGLEKYHPYTAYESGDFLLAYATDEENKLAGRALVHKDSKTFSAIYGVSKPAVDFIHEKLKTEGYRFVDEEGMAWEGAKLLHLIDDWENPDDPDEHGEVVIAPYVDFWDSEEAYTDGEYIHLVNERPDDGKKYKRLDMCFAEGFNEL